MVEREEGMTRLVTAVDRARTALLSAVSSDPQRWWTAEELEATTRDAWSSSELMIALYELVDGRQLDRDERFRVRLAA